MVAPEPGLFSTWTGLPKARDKRSATTRAVASTPPPGGRGTMILIGLEGYDCAPRAQLAFNPMMSAAKADVRICLLIMVRSNVNVCELKSKIQTSRPAHKRVMVLFDDLITILHDPHREMG